MSVAFALLLASVEISLSRAAGPEAVRPGERFELIVERSYEPHLEVDGLDPAGFAPLIVRLEQHAVEHLAGRTVETLRYEAFAFVLEDLWVPALTVSARSAAGDVFEARSEPLLIRIEPELDPAALGRDELPLDPTPPTERGPGVLAWLVGALGVLLLCLGWLQRRRPGGDAAAPSIPGARERAGELLESLSQRLAGSPAATSPAEIAATIQRALREYLGADLEGGGVGLSSEQLEGALTHHPEEKASDIRKAGDLLRRLDALRFGGHAPAMEELTVLLERAREIVTAETPT